ncbi:MAG: hypothetical protein WBS54_08435 [Acidobacteriota bacterium]
MNAGRGIVLAGLLAGLAVAASGAGRPLRPGEIAVAGSTDQSLVYRITYAFGPETPGLPPIEALKVYSEPSHTLLLALCSVSAPDSIVAQIQAEHPRAMAGSELWDQGGSVALDRPPEGDRRIRVVTVVGAADGTETRTLVQGSFAGLAQFSFSVRPLPDGKTRICGGCEEAERSCIETAAPEFTLCCPRGPIRQGDEACP